MADASGELLRLGNRRELFVDPYLIDRLDGVSLKLHEPQPAGTAIKYDRPWEGRGCAYITVLEDDGVYRMYYRGSPGDAPEVTCYAESADGIEWTKPDLGLFDVAGTQDNNVILTPEAAGDALPTTSRRCSTGAPAFPSLSSIRLWADRAWKD